MPEQELQEQENDFSLKNLFVPLTTFKAIHWIVIVGLIVYFNVFFNNFVWDDISYIITNTELQNTNILKLFSKNMFNNSGYYRPIPAIYFTTLFNIFGIKAFFYHFIQVSLHIVDTCLLFIFLKKFMKSTIAFFMVILFLVHPIQVESVAYIGASQSELLFLFGILALLLSIRNKLTNKTYLLISLFSLLAILTKEVSFIFIFLILLYQLLFYKSRILKIFYYQIAVVAIYFFIRFTIGGVYFNKITFVPIGRLSLFERLINIPEIILYYLKTLIYPARLAIEQHWIITTIDFPHFYFPLLLDALFFLFLGFLGLYVFKKNRKSFHIFIFFCLWFLSSFFMILQIFPLDMTVADRWFYLPFAGFLGICGLVIQQFKFQQKTIKTICILLLSFIIIALSIRTIIRNSNWYTGLTLYAHDVPLEDNFDNRANYAAVLSNEGKNDQVFVQIQKSVELYPYEGNLRSLGLCYMKMGKPDKAIEYYYKALHAKSFAGQNEPHLHDFDTYYAIASFQISHKNLNEGKRIAVAGVKDYPEAAKLWLLLAVSEYGLKDRQNAMIAVEKAYTLNPDQQTTYVRTQILNNAPIAVGIR
jgi:protein O-mannosyl-transferase